MAKMGHDLTIVAEDWKGTLVVGETPEACKLSMNADLGSLRVREGSGGAKPLNDDDKAKINRNAQGAFTKGHALSFASDSIRGSWESGTVTGRLTLNDETQEQTFDVVAVEGGYKLTGVITQTRFGLKPFSAMMGALKLGDDIGVTVFVKL